MMTWERWPRWDSLGRAGGDDHVTIVDPGDGGSQDTGTTLDVDISAATIGQLAVVDISYAGADSATITVPAGWATEFEEHTANVGWSGTYWLLIDAAGDLDVHQWTFSATAAASYAINYYTCVNEETPVSSTGKKGNGNGGTSTAPGTNSGGNKKNKTVLVVATATGKSATPQGGYTETIDTAGAGSSVATAVSNQATSGATGNVTATLSGSDYWMARLYTIAPCGSLAIPAPPINLAVSATGAGSVTLTWDDVATDETGFEVERSTNQTVWTQIATPTAGVETYTDLTAASQTLYYYRVRAVNANGNSAWAGPVSTTTSAMPDFGTFEYWQGGLLPSGGPNGLDNGNFEYWQGGLLPPVWTVV
jgi:hypothetical protein